MTIQFRPLTTHIGAEVEGVDLCQPLSASQIEAIHEAAPGLPDIDWFDERGESLSSEAWENPEARALAMRRAGASPQGRVDVLTLLLNASSTAIDFTLPPPAHRSTIVLDTATAEQREREVGDAPIAVAAHSLMLVASQGEA